MARPITALTDSFKIFRDNVNTISNNVGDPDLLTTTTRASQRSDSSDVVSALNELDSDLHGAGGGDVKSDLNYLSYAINTVRDSGLTGAINAIDAYIGGDSDTLNVEANTIKNAINEIEAVFDASTKKINSAPNFVFDGGADLEINVDGGDVTFKKDSDQYAKLTLGTTTVLDMTVAGQITTGDSAGGNFEIDAGGDITLDADGNQIRFKNGAGGDEVTHNLNDDATYEIDAPSTYTVDAGGDVILDAAGGNVTFKDGGTTDYNFATNGTISRTGDLTLDISGDIVLDAAGDNITFKDAGSTRVTYTLGNTTTVQHSGSLTDSVGGDHIENINGNQTVTVDSDYTLNADSATVSTARNFKVDAGSNIVLDADGGNVIIQDGGTEDYRFNTNGTISRTGNFIVDVSGDITLDADGGDIYFKDGGTTDYQFKTDGTISRTGDLAIDVSGDITLDADGNQIRFKNGAGGDEVTHTLADNAGYTVAAPSDYVVDAVGDIILDAADSDVILKRDGTVFGTFTAKAGDNNLIVKSGSTTALTFTGANLVTSGTVETGGNLTMGGATISRTGALTLDVSSNISLDADGGNIYLKDGGTTYGALKNSGGDLVIRNRSADHVTFDSTASATFVGNVIQGTSLNTSSGHLGGAINEVHDELDSASSDLQTTKGRVNTLESEMDSNEARIGVSVQFNIDNPYSWSHSTSNRAAINDLDSAVGTLSSLDATTYQGNSRNNVVRALNAVAGDLQDLQDSAGTLDGRIGSLSNLAAFFDSSGATSSIVNALNHMASRVVDIYDENGTLLNT